MPQKETPAWRPSRRASGVCVHHTTFMANTLSPLPPLNKFNSSQPNRDAVPIESEVNLPEMRQRVGVSSIKLLDFPPDLSKNSGGICAPFRKMSTLLVGPVARLISGAYLICTRLIFISKGCASPNREIASVTVEPASPRRRLITFEKA